MMPDNNYSIDELLAELRARRSEIESRIAGKEKASEEAPAADAAVAGKEEEPAAEETAVPVPEEIPAAEEAPVTEEPDAPAATADSTEEYVPVSAGPAAAEEPEEAEKEDVKVYAPEEKEEESAKHDTIAFAALNGDVSQLRNIKKQLTETFERPEKKKITEEFNVGREETAEEEDRQVFSLDEVEDIKREQIDSHPLFTGAVEAAERRERFVEEEPVPAPEKAVTDEDDGVEVRKASAFEKTGVLNIKEAEDDETFRTFFGDTVLVEHNDETRKKNEAPTPKPEARDAAPVDDPAKVISDLTADRQELIIRSAAQLLIALIALLFNTALVDTMSDGAFYGANVFLCLFTIGLNLKDIFKGIKGLFTGKAGSFSMAGASAVVSLIQSVVSLISDRVPAPMAVTVTAFAVFFADLAALLDASRNYSNYRRISVIPRKYASLMLDDPSLSKALAHDLNVPFENILIKRRAGVIDGFTAYSSSEDTRFTKSYSLQRWSALLAAAAGIACGVINDGGATGVMDCLAMAFAIMAPFGIGLASALPVWKTQKKLDQLSAVLPGYPAAEELCSANCIVLEGRELFPRDKVLLHGIKTFEKERVDKAILYAASVLINSCDTMSHMFMKVIQGKTEMLYDADSIVYEEGLGFSFWVDQSRILVGKRELLEAHEISVPSRDYENRYTKTSTRDAIYLAVSGKLYAMFVISYQPDDDMQKMLEELVKQQKNIIVRTRDFILSADKIARMYDIPRSMVSVVRDGYMNDLTVHTEPQERSASLLTHVGSASSFISGLLAGERLTANADMSSVINTVVMGIAAVLAVLLAVLGTLGTTGVGSVLLFQFIWLAIHCAAVLARRTL